MKQFFTQCAYAALFTLSLLSCKKEDAKNTTPDNPDTPASIVGTWKVTSLMSDRELDFNNNGVLTKDFFSNTEECYKDNRWLFDANGNFTYDEGATKCDPDADQSFTVPYTLTGNSLQGVGDRPATITRLDKTTLEFTVPAGIYTYDNDGQITDSIPFIATYSFARQ